MNIIRFHGGSQQAHHRVVVAHLHSGFVWEFRKEMFDGVRGRKEVDVQAASTGSDVFCYNNK